MDSLRFDCESQQFDQQLSPTLRAGEDVLKVGGTEHRDRHIQWQATRTGGLAQPGPALRPAVALAGVAFGVDLDLEELQPVVQGQIAGPPGVAQPPGVVAPDLEPGGGLVGPRFPKRHAAAERDADQPGCTREQTAQQHRSNGLARRHELGLSGLRRDAHDDTGRKRPVPSVAMKRARRPCGLFVS